MSEVVLHNFAAAGGGASSQSPVALDRAGNLYGTTFSGGLANAGVVFKIDTSGRATVLHHFTGGADGGGPQAGVLVDGSGNLFGTASVGGALSYGVLFKLDPSGNETVLHSFTGTDGSYPDSSLIRDAAGNLYGTAGGGGSANMGVLYKLDAAGRLTVLHNFTGPDGAFPFAGVTFDKAGNLYGTTQAGGDGGGVVYKIDTGGVQTILHAFGGPNDGFAGSGGVILDAEGNLYGNTIEGGTSGAGIIYKISPAGAEKVLYSFSGGADGKYPSGALAADSAGNLYGATSLGGSAGQGVVFKFSSAHGETVLHHFAGGADGAYPQAGVVRDGAGNLFGTTYFGGSGNLGVVYEVDASTNETVLKTFAGRDGTDPQGGLLSDGAGNLYGTAYEGGLSNAGAIFKVDSSGRETILYSFTGGADGSFPVGNVIQDAAGNFYGTTSSGGDAMEGTVYKLDNAGHETVLYSFKGGVDGYLPAAGVTADQAGNLYGTTPYGGFFGHGLVYKIDPAGNETVLYNFVGSGDGTQPYGSLSLDSHGNLYGTTLQGGSGNEGIIFKITPAGRETIVYSFSGESGGANPYSGVIRDDQGNFYGSTSRGGTADAGVVYKLFTSGQETVLYNFTGGADGRDPTGEVFRDSAGNVYGTTYFGGADNLGVVYKVDITGAETVLHSFTGGVDGGRPMGGVIRDGAGNLYGTASMDGKRGAGLVFKLKAGGGDGL